MSNLLSSTVFFASLQGFQSAASIDAPLWLKEVRHQDQRLLAAMAVPAFNDEAWKYTSLNSLLSQSFVLAAPGGADLPTEFSHLWIDGAINVVVLNGHITGCGQSPAGISFLTGELAFNGLKNDRQYLETITANDSELFLRLNRLLFNDPLVIQVEPGVEIKELVHIINIVTDRNAAIFPRVALDVGAGSAVNILQTCVSVPESEALVVPVMDMVLEEGARCEYAERHKFSLLANYVGSVRVWQKKDSRFTSFVSSSGAAIFRSNLSVLLAGEGAVASINGLHDLAEDSHADSHTFLDHAAPDTGSDQLYKCVLKDAAHSVFNGRVFVHSQAQKTNSYQLNKNLLLSRECQVHTKPQLEIQADDVKCTHGATIGQLAEDQLFYLQTRAVSREDAVTMLVRGFMEDALLRVKHPLIRSALRRD